MRALCGICKTPLPKGQRRGYCPECRRVHRNEVQLRWRKNRGAPRLCRDCRAPVATTVGVPVCEDCKRKNKAEYERRNPRPGTCEGCGGPCSRRNRLCATCWTEHARQLEPERCACGRWSRRADGLCARCAAGCEDPACTETEPHTHCRGITRGKGKGECGTVIAIGELRCRECRMDQIRIVLKAAKAPASMIERYRVASLGPRLDAILGGAAEVA